MATEIERKFLVDRNHPEVIDLLSKKGADIKQGYIASSDSSVVRVRTLDEKAFLTVKGATTGVSRPEFEYEIPKADAETMLETLCGPIIIKTRWELLLSGGLVLELDVFPQIDLMLAEVELSSEDQEFEKPEWLLEEVSTNPEYFNNNIASKIGSLGTGLWKGHVLSFPTDE